MPTVPRKKNWGSADLWDAFNLFLNFADTISMLAQGRSFTRDPETPQEVTLYIHKGENTFLLK